MVSTPTKKKRGRDDKKLSPLSSQPRHLWDSPSSRNKKSTKTSSVTSSCTRSQRKKLLFDKKGLDEQDDENTTADKDIVSSKKKKRSSPAKASKDKPTDETNAALSDLIPESSYSPSGSCKSLLIGPKFNTFSNSLSPPSDKSSKHSSSTSSTTTAKKEDGDKMSPLHPPRRSSLRSHKSNTSSSNSDQFKDFTMTPTILYNNNNIYQHPLSAGGNRHYHQSPHWSGQVRVNPFSPIPEQYLRPPPTSAQSVPYKSRKQRNYHPGFYNKLINLDSPTLQLGTTTTSNEQQTSLATEEPQKKKARLNPSPAKKRSSLKTSSFPQLKLGNTEDMLDDDISPNDAMQVNDLFGSSTKLSGSKRRVSFNKRVIPQPQSMKEDESDMREEAPSNKRMCIKRRGRYLNDFEEVQFLGAGSFGSVNACLSRLDGCMYAVKSISPTGQTKTPGTANSGGSQADIESGTSYLYGGRKMMSSSQCAVPPTPRSDLCPVKKTKSRTIGCSNLDDDNTNDFGMLEGSTHWNDGTLRRMLREVFALAALCQQDDFRTFHIVRYQQAWLEDDGTLYIQTELCSATLRDEMSDKKKTIDVSKLLREVLLALELVHQQGMVHLDIKPENIFVSKNGLYKLGDFGMANAFTESGRKSSATPEIEEGDSRYMSKDLLDFSPKDLTKCDIFSLGATLYELCLGKSLPTCGDEWQDLRNGKLDKGIDEVEFGDIIKEMMHPDADKRPSATDLLSRDALRSSDASEDSFLSRYKVTKTMKST